MLAGLARGDEGSKCFIGRDEGLSLILQAIQSYKDEPGVVLQAVKALAALTLRNPGHSERVVALGGAGFLAEIMIHHGKDDGVQIQCCTLLRHLARSEQLIPLMRDVGAEELVKCASRLPRCTELAFSTLRALQQKP